MPKPIAVILLLLGFNTVSVAQGGDKISWRGKGAEDPKAILAEAKRLGKPMMLFFTTEGSGPCKWLSTVPFCDAKVVEASKKIVCVYVDCDGGKKNKDLCERYKVTAYPAVMFCEPDGKLFREMTYHDAAGILWQMSDLIRSCSRKPSFPEGIAKISLEAKKVSKPFAIYFYDDSDASCVVNQSFFDELLKETLEKIVFAKAEYKKGSEECARYSVTSAPMIVVLDLSLEKPEEKPLARITGSKNPKEMKAELENALHPNRPDGSTTQNQPAGSSEIRWVVHLKTGGKLKAISVEEKEDKYILKIGGGGTVTLLKENVDKISKYDANEK